MGAAPSVFALPGDGAVGELEALSVPIVTAASDNQVAPLRVVVLIQENKTTDFYFPSLADWEQT